MVSMAKKSDGAVENCANLRQGKDLRAGAGQNDPLKLLENSVDDPHLGVAGSNPATPTSPRTDTRTDTPEIQPAVARFAVGTYEPTTGEFLTEFETDSRFKAWLWEQKIGWRELLTAPRLRRLPRLSFVATRPVSPAKEGSPP